MQRFLNKDTQIMVATTVIEVGVNIPNATTMVIESAEKFGLSQLHQLRGRVGRGKDKSFCILLTSSKLNNEARERLKIMCATTDGFKIAEKDMEIRGPGDVAGTRQSGVLDFKLADLILDIPGGEHGFGTAAQIALVETFLNAALATCQLLAYPGVHSKSSRDWGDEHWLNTHETPETPKDFEFFHKLHAA
jgi:RecG-like helicase